MDAQGVILGAILEPKLIQNWCTNRYQNWYRKSVEKWCQNDPNIMKIIKKSIANRSIFWKSDFSKNMFLHLFYNVFWRLRVAKVDQQSSKNQSKIDARKSDRKCSQNHLKLCQNCSKIAPKSLQNRCKNRLKYRCEICCPKIDEKSSLGAPKGRQADFDYSTMGSFLARWVPRTNWK